MNQTCHEKARVVVVESIKDSRIRLCRLLKLEHYNVAEFRSWYEAERYLVRRMPNIRAVLVNDIEPGKRVGERAARFIRARKNEPYCLHYPVVLVHSAVWSSKQRLKIIEADAFVPSLNFPDVLISDLKFALAAVEQKRKQTLRIRFTHWRESHGSTCDENCKLMKAVVSFPDHRTARLRLQEEKLLYLNFLAWYGDALWPPDEICSYMNTMPLYSHRNHLLTPDGLKNAVSVIRREFESTTKLSGEKFIETVPLDGREVKTYRVLAIPELDHRYEKRKGKTKIVPVRSQKKKTA